MRVRLFPSDSPGDTIILDHFPAVVGKSLDADIPLADEDSSDFHCWLEEFAGNLILRDCDSPSGSFVNGAAVLETALMPGDRVTLGRTTFVISYERLATQHPPATRYRLAENDFQRAKS